MERVSLCLNGLRHEPAGAVPQNSRSLVVGRIELTETNNC